MMKLLSGVKSSLKFIFWADNWRSVFSLVLIAKLCHGKVGGLKSIPGGIRLSDRLTKWTVEWGMSLSSLSITACPSSSRSVGSRFFRNVRDSLQVEMPPFKSDIKKTIISPTEAHGFVERSGVGSK